jgi:predicted DNA-binding protein
MRTTVELSDDLIAALHALAVRKRYRGYLNVLEEAIAHFLEENEKKDLSLSVLLKMRGSWSSKEAAATRRRLEEIRKNWRA